jgi:hypothetical protein
MGGILFGNQSSGPSEEEIRQKEEDERRRTEASARARARRRGSRSGTSSLVTTPKSTGLNIPGGNT